uniref:Uncharacterized protein n=2 Tax=Aegilops tauschii subsp. strangulata TaxID=200361 RepID=A0A453ETD6_AEGTS
VAAFGLLLSHRSPSSSLQDASRSRSSRRRRRKSVSEKNYFAAPMGCSAGTPARTPFSVLEADVRSYKYTSTPSTEATAQLRRFVRARHLCTVVLPMSSESRRFAEVTGICLYCRLHWKYVRPCSQVEKTFRFQQKQWLAVARSQQKIWSVPAKKEQFQQKKILVAVTENGSQR